MDWIKIEQQKPKEKQAVIYYFELCGVYRGLYSQTDHGEEEGLDENGETYKGDCFYGREGWLTDDVTHWMPDEGQELPNPPE